MNDIKNKKRFISACIVIVILLIVLRFCLFFLKSDGFSGISPVLPILLFGFILFALATSVFFMAWVYEDCKMRGDDPVLWAVVVLIATPFIGLLVYFLRRPEQKQNCPACRQQISLKANYCEKCGARIERKESTVIMERKGTHHLIFIAAGMISMLLMLACMAGFIVNAASGNTVNMDAASNERVWNLGVIHMNYNTYRDGVWKLDFKSASDGFIKQEDMKIADAETQVLYADISCKAVKDDSTLVLWLVQGDVVQSVDVTDLSEPLEYPLEQFENGKIHVRLQINGVEDTTAEISIK